MLFRAFQLCFLARLFNLWKALRRLKRHFCFMTGLMTSLLTGLVTFIVTDLVTGLVTCLATGFVTCLVTSLVTDFMTGLVTDISLPLWQALWLVLWLTLWLSLWLALWLVVNKQIRKKFIRSEWFHQNFQFGRNNTFSFSAVIFWVMEITFSFENTGKTG